ncbi:MAG: FAD binding domain-containing protein [Candidatus Marinimicrobia bacterium]|nr:FAD binding domain-containing protein [Candidatus Neomarinimicrobiota bacterium]
MVDGIRPENLQQALKVLSKRECIIVAGGTDLMVQRARGFALAPKFEKPLLFIAHLAELKKIYVENDEIHIGACAILTDIIESEIAPTVFKKMIGQMASPPTRNMATISGNICNASPAGDTLPYLYAMKAKVVLQNVGNTRILPIDEFIISPKKTCLRSDEIMTDIIIPNKDFSINYYRKLGQRKGMSLTKTSLLGMADVTDGRVTDIRIALGSVAAGIVRSSVIEKSMISKSVDEIKKSTDKILEQYDVLIRPIDDARSTATYRKKVSLRLIKDFLERLV